MTQMLKSLLIANRGEIAVRIARSAASLGVSTVAIYSTDDASAQHRHMADKAIALTKAGPAAYLDGPAIIAAALAAGCDAIHPGYGFLAENAAFAQLARRNGLIFVGPSTETLSLFGDKAVARAFAQSLDVPLAPGGTIAHVEEAMAFFDAQQSPNSASGVILKAVAGGGGRGVRLCGLRSEIPEAFARCQSEAVTAFGDGALYIERLVQNARHIEVQIAGDRFGAQIAIGDRECSVQRRQQKLIEIAPAPNLDSAMRLNLQEAALKLAAAANYQNLGTFEFLVDCDSAAFYFMEANARLQVEHTVTEEAFDIDLVSVQLKIASGQSLNDLDLSIPPKARATAIELRINAETPGENRQMRPTAGEIVIFEPNAGPGVRVDSFVYAGYRSSAAFDSLLAKIIARAKTFHEARTKILRALGEFRLEGLAINADFLRAILSHPAFIAGDVTTRFVETHWDELCQSAQALTPRKFFNAEALIPSPIKANKPERQDRAGAWPVVAPLQGTIVAFAVAPGALVKKGQTVAVMEAMKMEHLVPAAISGIICDIAAAPGDALMVGEALAFIAPGDVDDSEDRVESLENLDAIRPDLADFFARKKLGLDENRPEAVARRRKSGQRTARENIADLCAGGDFREYGALAVAARRSSVPLDQLQRTTPADGVVAGIGTVNAAQCGALAARCMIVAYDYTVLAGTQGHMNHKKQDRLFALAAQWAIPLVLFAEGGGGRPGDTDGMGLTGLDVPTFAQFAALSGKAPLVGVVSGRCFAGNAALLGCCDVIIATEDATIGMGGPAMIEGGGLGVYRPEGVGPVSMQAPNGVIDILVRDEAEAVSAAKKYLSYVQGPLKDFVVPDQRRLRAAIPENRLRVYDIRPIIETLADEGGVLELREKFGVGVVTAMVRIGGAPFGLIANNSKHLGGAIDADAADKAARFMQLCQSYGLPIVALCDTPGFMVGPEAEKTGLARHVSRLFVTAAKLTVPYFTIILRKGYGLGAMAMAAGGFHKPVFTIAWPSGEFGGMGLEGYVRLGFRSELAAIADPAAREKRFRDLVDDLYQKGKAANIASALEIDGVIDPVETRDWILAGINGAGFVTPRKFQPGEEKMHGFIDPW